MQKDINVLIPARSSVPQTTIHVKIVAENDASLATKPHLIILPGGPGANHTHYAAYERLISVANIIFFDPRGCGLSDKSDPLTYTMDNYIEDVEVMRSELQLDNVMILGKSYGAMCALGYALRYPNNISKLILASGAPSYRFFEEAKENLSRLGTDEQKRLCDILFKGAFKNDEEFKLFFEKTRTLYSYKKKHNLSFEMPIASLPFSREALNQGFSSFLHTFNFEDQLADIKLETLIIVGDEDWLTDKAQSIKMKDRIPNSQLIIIPKSGHSIELDAPDLFFFSIEKFIKNF